MLNRKEHLWNKKYGKTYLGFEGRYQVSNLGRVKSLKRVVKTGRNGHRTIQETIIKPRLDKKRGYQTINLRIYPKRYSFSLHKLVAELFIPNPDNLPEVNHKDNNPSNNRADNLEWCNQSYNIKYAYKYGNAKPTSGCFKKGNIPHNLKKVSQYDKKGNFIKTYSSVKLAAKSINRTPTSIFNCLAGRTRYAGGYIWRYADD